MKTTKLPALVLAIALQVMPLCRVVTTAVLPASSPVAAVMQWIIGAVALLGTCHAVSGASTVITSPLTATGTNGVAFDYRITCGPQVASSFGAAPLPAGLTVNTTSGRITGTPTVTGVTSVTISASGSGHTTSSILTLTIVAGGASPPAITTQPRSQTVTVGANVSFSVAASGTAPLKYQWRFNASALAGQTGTSLALTNVTTSQAGTYTVVVTNTAGSVSSAAAVLTVNPPPVAPAITTQPQDQTVTAGTTASFSAAASGTAPLSYQWKFNNSALAGKTGTALALASVTVGQAGSYTVVVTNAAGSVTSSAALLTVNPAPVAPAITTQPQSQTVTAGADVNFSVAASGTAPLSYQWRFNNSALAGQTGTALALASVTTSQAGSYTVVVTNVAGSVASAAAVLTVNPALVAPAITTQPQSQNVTAGANVSFSVAASGTAPLSYQWRFNNSALAGQTGTALALASVTTSQAGSYTVVVTNVAGSVASAAAVLTVSPAPVAPTITTQPQGQSVTAGANVSFSVAASGTAPLSYQWRFNNSALAGQTGTALALASVTTSQAGSYTVVVTNVAGSVASATAVLTVNPAPVAPAITTQPQNQNVTAGANVSFSVAASGTAPLSYQWRFNDSALAGKTGTALALASVTTSQAGSYTVVVTNVAGSVASAAAVMTVNPAPVAPAITTQPQNQTVTAGANVSFAVAASGTATLSYQWRFNNSALAGQTGTALALASVTTSQAGSYTVVVTNVAGSVASAAAVLTVNPAPVAPTITTQPQNQTVTAGANVGFSVAASGTAPLSYQWRFNNSALAGQTGTALALTSVTTNQAGSYTVVVTNSAGSVASSPALLTVTPPQPDPDTTRPTLEITSPSGSVLSGVPVFISGTASDNVGIQNVFYSINGGPFNSATGAVNWATWSTPSPVPVAPGTNIVLAYSVDLSGNCSPTNTRTYVCGVSSPFQAVAGQFNGLFYETNGVEHGTSGSFRFSLSSRGAYTASLLTDSRRLLTSGQLDLQGHGFNTVLRQGTNPLSVTWSVDLNGSDQINGTVTEGNWTAPLTGDRAVFGCRTNPCFNAGKYTFVLPGTPGASVTPEGDSYGVIAIDNSGTVRCKAYLADRTSAAQQVPLSRNGEWPLYVPLYGGKGSLLAWVKFTDRTSDDFNGLSSWSKPPLPAAAYYPIGFTQLTEITGSRYATPLAGAQRVLDLTNAVARFCGGNLASSCTNELSLGFGNRVVNLGPNSLSLVFNLSSGLFRGSVTPATTARPISFGGVVLQKANNASGFFLGTNQSGGVYLQDAR